MKHSLTSRSARAKAARQNSLKSLLALASGAASISALTPAAQADIIYSSFGVTPLTVGWTPGATTSYSWGLPGGGSIILGAEAAPNGTNTDANRILAKAVGGLFARQADARSAAPNPPGVNVGLRTGYGFTWNNAAPGQRLGSATFGNIILSTITSNFLNGPGTFNTTKYLLFNFQNGGTTEYGWIGMSGATYTGAKEGMSVSFTGWAYDNTGATIPAGKVGAVPEPSTLAIGGLMAAMVVGSRGLRRWRQSHPANASTPA